MSARERTRIVEAISNHEDLLARRLERLHMRRLGLRRGARRPLLNSRSFCGPRDPLCTISGKKFDFDTHRF